MSKVNADRNQRALLELVQKAGNDQCADCKSRVPRWTSYNIGIFICVSCASVHRKMGTHISKVKSMTMDTWTKEQVEVMKQNGNLKSNAYYNPNEVRNPPPTNMGEQERDSELEKYIRAKYEFKRFIAREAPTSTPSDLSRSSTGQVAPQSKFPPARSVSAAPLPFAQPQRGDSLDYRPSPTVLPTKPSSQLSASPMQQSRSVSQPLPSLMAQRQPQPIAQPQMAPPSAPVAPQLPSSNPVWNDLVSLQSGSAASSSFPLQYQPHTQASLPPQQPFGQNLYGNSIGAPSMFGQQQVVQSPGSHAPQNGAMGMGMGMGGQNPFQQQQQLQLQQQFTSNPFGQPSSYLSPAGGQLGGMSSAPIQSFQSSIPPFSQSAAGQQFQASLQSQQCQQPQSQSSAPSFFQPQPQPPGQLQPYGQQQPSPYGQQQSSPIPYGQQPSPFGQQPSPMPFGQQPSPQPLQHQQQQQGVMMQNGNPFGQWQQQAPQQGGFQGGFQGQQQWNGM